MDLAHTIQLARASLRRAELSLAGHAASLHGLCTCLRPMPCHVRADWDAEHRHWRGKLAELEARQRAAISGETTLLPTLAAGSHPRLG